MGVLFDYFAAATDDEAAAVIDRLGGPGAPPPQPAPTTAPRGFFRRLRTSKDSDPEVLDDWIEYDTVSVKGIDPVVQIGMLEGLLTGRPFDEVLDDPRTGEAVAMKDGGELLVLTLNDQVSAALAASDDATLARVAVPWSQTEEFHGRADPSDLAEFLTDLASLARRSAAAGSRLYCWICV